MKRWEMKAVSAPLGEMIGGDGCLEPLQGEGKEGEDRMVGETLRFRMNQLTIPSGAPVSTPAGVGISDLPTDSSRTPASRVAVVSPPLGSSTNPFPPLQRATVIPAQGPDADFLERLSSGGRCHGRL
ncbi:hypothetical protein Nepgr_006757 [Nepenthes gracilis]|uniref:Uncharacterized protein n=1 Tax=Nepenthes gracilis TaxID=150966 RepID=A0AAD3XHM1_NEPGR|nr:hypothetical protein Nepgr_006757 [Nepenthes gracilis]